MRMIVFLNCFSDKISVSFFSETLVSPEVLKKMFPLGNDQHDIIFSQECFDGKVVTIDWEAEIDEQIKKENYQIAGIIYDIYYEE